MLGGAEEGERRGTEEGEGSGTPVLGGEEERKGGGTKEGEGAGKLAQGRAEEREGVPAASIPLPTIYAGFGVLRTARTPRGTGTLRVPESFWAAEEKFQNATLTCVANYYQLYIDQVLVYRIHSNSLMQSHNQCSTKSASYYLFCAVRLERF